MVPAKIIYTNN